MSVLLRLRPSVLRVGTVLLLVLPLVGGKCRLRNEPTVPQAWARILRVTYTRPPEFVNPAWCSEFGRLRFRTLEVWSGAGRRLSVGADSVTLGPPDVYVWDRSLEGRRIAEGHWTEMIFAEVCVPNEPGVGLACWTGENLDVEVEVPPGYRLEREIAVYLPHCSDTGPLKQETVLRLRLVRE